MSSQVDSGRPGFLDPQGHRLKIIPDDVHGRFVRWRRIVYAVLVVHLLALPFIRNGQHPAIHLDFPARRFYLAGWAFNAQDAWLIFFLLIAIAFGLVFITSLAGRVWCGWACPQTVFLEGIYRRIERLIEGSADARRRLIAEGWTAKHVGLFAAKQAAFLAVSFVLAHWLLAFFIPMAQLPSVVMQGPAAHPQAFIWALGLTALFMFDFAWFREQTCVIVCPYGRFQSVLTDRQSLLIGYDETRGEPRHKLIKTSAAAHEAVGDCVDCGKCVRVCPTGIDIRHGQQLECIGCAQCIDACDEVMEKLHRPRGLIRYDSLAGFAKEPKRLLRPRLLVYATLSAVAVVTVVLNVTRVRTEFEANLLRAGRTPYVLDGDTVRNQFELHVINKHTAPDDFEIEVTTLPAAQVVLAQSEVHLASLESARAPIFVTLPRAQYQRPFEVQVRLRDRLDGKTKDTLARFLGPPNAP